VIRVPSTVRHRCPPTPRRSMFVSTFSLMAARCTTFGTSHYRTERITDYATQDSFSHRNSFNLENDTLEEFNFKEDFIVLSQNPRFKEDTRFIKKNLAHFTNSEFLRLLRPCQPSVVRAIQRLHPKTATSNSSRWLPARSSSQP